MDRLLQIECALKQPDAPPQRQIKVLGGHDAQGKPWRLFQQDCINEMWRGTRFYVVHEGVPVEMEIGWNGLQQYIRSPEWLSRENLLLDLPDFPAACDRRRPPAGAQGLAAPAGGSTT
ncbi:MAG: hypothetical protein EKK41_08575 [Hyphomicrobiales bacterium]|jgi:hypothetical protein|nr:MAG: hypothetical protein EKK41_08575 [Hyphomicrobiales bacterium]